MQQRASVLQKNVRRIRHNSVTWTMLQQQQQQQLTSLLRPSQPINHHPALHQQASTSIGCQVAAALSAATPLSAAYCGAALPAMAGCSGWPVRSSKQNDRHNHRSRMMWTMQQQQLTSPLRPSQPLKHHPALPPASLHIRPLPVCCCIVSSCTYAAAASLQ
jgi:hypothetical protein